MSIVENILIPDQLTWHRSVILMAAARLKQDPWCNQRKNKGILENHQSGIADQILGSSVCQTVYEGTPKRDSKYIACKLHAPTFHTETAKYQSHWNQKVCLMCQKHTDPAKCPRSMACKLHAPKFNTETAKYMPPWNQKVCLMSQKHTDPAKCPQSVTITWEVRLTSWVHADTAKCPLSVQVHKASCIYENHEAQGRTSAEHKTVIYKCWITLRWAAGYSKVYWHTRGCETMTVSSIRIFGLRYIKTLG